MLYNTKLIKKADISAVKWAKILKFPIDSGLPEGKRAKSGLQGLILLIFPSAGFLKGEKTAFIRLKSGFWEIGKDYINLKKLRLKNPTEGGM